MPAAKRTTPRRAGSAQTDPDVDAFMRDLEHPLKDAVEDVRRTILSVSKAIKEGIKWNAPSFRTDDYFATLNLRARDGEERVWLILHTGAKSKTSRIKRADFIDPKGLLEWLAKDRCLVTFADAADVKSKRTALKAIIRDWISLL